MSEVLAGYKQHFKLAITPKETATSCKSSCTSRTTNLQRMYRTFYTFNNIYFSSRGLPTLFKLNKATIQELKLKTNKVSVKTSNEQWGRLQFFFDEM